MERVIVDKQLKVRTFKEKSDGEIEEKFAEHWARMDKRKRGVGTYEGRSERKKEKRTIGELKGGKNMPF